VRPIIGTIVSNEWRIVEFADLASVDISKANTPEGRAELYPQLRDALRTHGFIYAINHGYTQAQARLVLVTLAKSLKHYCSATGSLI
jgi:isopenicillin N synthase-like dioxygenase